MPCQQMGFSAQLQALAGLVSVNLNSHSDSNSYREYRFGFRGVWPKMMRCRPIRNAPKTAFIYVTITMTVLYFFNLTYSILRSGGPVYQAQVQDHFENLENDGRAKNGFILGGSNAVYGLSAELLSKDLGINFYNFSFSYEALNLSNYDALLKRADSISDFSKVEVVIWSSFQIYSSRNHQHAFRPSIFPNMSLLRAAKNGFAVTEVTRQRSMSNFGDLNFATVECSGPSVSTNSLYPKPAFLAYLGQVIPMLRKRFPTARIVLVAPSLFKQPNVPRDYLSDVQSLAREFGAEFVLQAEIESSAEICDANHHPNAVGRTARTGSLAKVLMSYVYKID